jgi:hypothetical protein
VRIFPWFAYLCNQEQPSSFRLLVLHTICEVYHWRTELVLKGLERTRDFRHGIQLVKRRGGVVCTEVHTLPAAGSLSGSVAGSGYRRDLRSDRFCAAPPRWCGIRVRRPLPFQGFHEAFEGRVIVGVALRLMLIWTLCSLRRSVYAEQAYCTPRSLWWISPAGGLRLCSAICSA